MRGKKVTQTKHRAERNAQDLRVLDYLEPILQDRCHLHPRQQTAEGSQLRFRLESLSELLEPLLESSLWVVPIAQSRQKFSASHQIPSVQLRAYSAEPACGKEQARRDVSGSDPQWSMRPQLLGQLIELVVPW